MKPIQKSVVLKTSAATDVLNSGGVISVTGLIPVPKKNLISIKQIKYKAEVDQVYTVGNSSYTPTASTKYTVEVYDPNRVVAGFSESSKLYSYVTPPNITTLGATAALQREAIHAQLVSKINLQTAVNHATAVSLGSGTGFTVTDSGPYYPVRSQTMTNILGANLVDTCTNPDGTGFVSGDLTLTTTAVASFGVGSILATAQTLTDKMFGNLISGEIEWNPQTTGGLPAVSGQNYDGFEIVSLSKQDTPTITGHYTYIDSTQLVYVDNGTGNSTTNLTGFIAFERAILRNLFELYKDDPSTIYDFFDAGLIASATYPTTGVAVTTTDNVVMATTGSQGFEWYVNPIGAHTVITPIVGTGGLSLILDATSQEGLELSAPILTQCPKEIVVGKQEYSWYGRVNATNYAHLKEFAFGLRKKAAYAVNTVAYDVASTDFASIGVVSAAATGLINIQTSKAAGGVVSTSTATTWTSGAHDILITVDINGAVRFYIDSVDVTSKQATAYTFTAGTHIIPFVDTTLDANVDAAPLALQVAALPTISWRS